MEKRKLDSRVRFQHANFTRKLDVARNYKRNAKPRSDNRLQAGLEKVGMASLLAQLLVAAGLIVVAYLVYVPNPLFIRSVHIEGMSEENKGAVNSAVEKYFDNRPWYVPANNILFFSPKGLAEAITKDVPAVSKIQSQSKSFKNKTVSISLIQKYERYLIVRPEDELVLYNDGTVKGQIKEKVSDLPQSGSVVTVSANDINSVENSAQYFSQQFLDFVEQSTIYFPERTNQNFAYFEVKIPENSLGEKFNKSWKKSSIMAVLNKKPEVGKSNPSHLKVVLEPGLDIAATADRLNLLIAQTAPDRYKLLYYVDLRLPNRAYLCLINTPCSTTNP